MIDIATWRRLGIAAALSATAHAAAIAFGSLDAPVAPPDLPPLAVRIERATPAPARKPPQAVASRPKREPRAAPSVVAHAVAERVPESASVQQPAEQSETPPAGPAPTTQVPAAEPPVVVATAPASTLAAEARPLPAFPRRGRITYNLVYGRDRFPVGLTVQHWEVDGNRYQLGSRSETSGIVDLIRSQHRTYASRGELTPEGLRPDTFLMSRDRGRGAEEAQAYFNWKTGSVTLGSSKERREQALSVGTQDLLSFMFQLALEPPAPGRLRLPVTNGTRLEMFELEVMPEERIETPLGLLRALPVRQIRAARSEGVDLWLAVEYRHLPVRIRFYGRDGEPAGEQIVTEIRLSED